MIKLMRKFYSLIKQGYDLSHILFYCQYILDILELIDCRGEYNIFKVKCIVNKKEVFYNFYLMIRKILISSNFL